VLDQNRGLKASVIVAVYPACATTQADLGHLHALVERSADRLTAHIWPLETVTDRSINALCLSSKDSDIVHFVAGTSEDLGVNPWKAGT